MVAPSAGVAFVHLLVNQIETPLFCGLTGPGLCTAAGPQAIDDDSYVAIRITNSLLGWAGNVQVPIALVLFSYAFEFE